MPIFETETGKTVGLSHGLLAHAFAEPGEGGLTTILTLPAVGLKFIIKGTVKTVWDVIERPAPTTEVG